MHLGIEKAYKRVNTAIYCEAFSQPTSVLPLGNVTQGLKALVNAFKIHLKSHLNFC